MSGFHAARVGRRAAFLVTFAILLRIHASPGERHVKRDGGLALVVLDKDAILTGEVGGRPQGTHEAGLREAILTTDLLGRGTADVLLVGAIPAALEAGAGLSPALEPACARVLAELARRGVRARLRGVPMPSGAWWQERSD